jgi:hypothetical protein
MPELDPLSITPIGRYAWERKRGSGLGQVKTTVFGRFDLPRTRLD